MRRGQRQFVKTRQTGPGRLGKLQAATVNMRRNAYAQFRAQPVPMQVRIAAPRRLLPAGEVKGMDTDLSFSPVIATTNTNASSFVLNLIQQGAGSWNRVGRKSHAKSLRIKGHLDFTVAPIVATGVSQQNSCRMVVVWDQQPSGNALPAFDTIFGITAQDGTESCPDITCPPKFDNMDRFRVLLDRQYAPNPIYFSSAGTGPSGQIQLPVDEYLRLSGQETVFSGQSAPMTIADISTGAIYVYFRALINGQSTVTSDLIARLRYTD